MSIFKTDWCLDLFKRAVIKWGHANQTLKIAEEAAELAAAVVRYRLFKGTLTNQYYDEMIEEMADIEITIAQFRHNVGISDKQFEDIIENKLRKMDRRLTDGEREVNN